MTPFATSMRAAPWLHETNPPWHMWGNSVQVEVVSESFGVARVATTQLTKVSYKRPETWHWLFAARLVSGPTPLSPQEAGVRVHFDVILGVGRSVVQILDFETFQWQWSDPGGGVSPLPPLSTVLYSTAAVGPNRAFNNASTPTPVANTIDQIVAQDIQVQCRLEGISNYPNTIVVEVSAFWSPKTHIRPDWLRLDAPDELQFPGAEVEGR